MIFAFFILFASLVAIIAACVEGWKIGLSEKLYDDAEEYAEQKYNDYLNSTEYIIHFKQSIIDEM